MGDANRRHVELEDGKLSASVDTSLTRVLSVSLAKGLKYKGERAILISSNILLIYST